MASPAYFRFVAGLSQRSLERSLAEHAQRTDRAAYVSQILCWLGCIRVARRKTTSLPGDAACTIAALVGSAWDVGPFLATSMKAISDFERARGRRELKEYVEGYLRGFIAENVLPVAKRGDSMLTGATIPAHVGLTIGRFSEGVRAGKRHGDILRDTLTRWGYKVEEMDDVVIYAYPIPTYAELLRQAEMSNNGYGSCRVS
eukprot:CAMPEP_0172736660 /NCGR_PEP_ID=MMETSP1074-20121228/115601_1 /TAXON_ID=2916 /ORGANISM="Ceratium fusus, Strain PA161109" /LENGTH=200 /DNA_ID=CAMNT_0013565899 /DNA_START=17 /DNA_END=615 /DNA_ORIENTATION=-